eukprot:4682758-Pleurochrysis_carterae.AAC.3
MRVAAKGARLYQHRSARRPPVHNRTDLPPHKHPLRRLSKWRILQGESFAAAVGTDLAGSLLRSRLKRWHACRWRACGSRTVRPHCTPAPKKQRNHRKLVKKLPQLLCKVHETSANVDGAFTMLPRGLHNYFTQTVRRRAILSVVLPNLRAFEKAPKSIQTLLSACGANVSTEKPFIPATCLGDLPRAELPKSGA